MKRLAAALAIFVASCELALPIHEVADVGAVDVMTVDAGDEGDAGGPVNLLQNAGFEQGATGCGSFWTAETGVKSFSISDGGRAGGRACAVCATSTGVTQHLGLRFDAGTHFTGSMWVSPIPGEAGIAGKLFVVMHVVDASPTQVYITVNKGNISTWTELTNGATPTSDVDTIDFAADLGTGGGCMLVDDTSLIAE